MLGFRYHIIYICVVFLMLGIGILIGFSIFPAQNKQQEKSLAALQVQVDGAVQDGRAAKAQLAQTEQAIDTLRTKLVRGKLAGKKIVIIQSSDYPQATTTAAEALNDAGATVLATVVVSDKIYQLSPKQLAAVSGDLPNAATGATSPDPNSADATDDSIQNDEAVTPIFAALAGLLRYGTASKHANIQIAQTLQAHGLVSINGDISMPCSLFVLIGGRKEETPGDANSSAAKIESLLIEQLNSGAETPATLVGCEQLDSGVSSVPTFQKYGIATVDCIDQPLGELALPFALRGGQDRDNYGLKRTATRQIPASLGEQPSI